MKQFIYWVDKILANILIILMAVIVLDVTWQVFTRFILGDPSSFTEELATFLLIWIGLLGASYALRTKSHLGIDVLTYRLKGVPRYIVDIMVYSLIILFCLFVMVIGGWKLVKLTLDLKQISAAMGLKVGYVYIVVPLSGLLMIFYSLLFIGNAIAAWLGKAPILEEKTESISIS